MMSFSLPTLEEDAWCRLIPLLHRILADPSLADQFPRVSGDRPLEDPCAVWETLHYLLQSLLGWESPGAGLAWWYAQGKPVKDSPLLQAVSTLWDRDHQLDWYAAWAWSQGLGGCFTPDQISPAERTRSSPCHDEGWWRAFRARPRPPGGDPFYGGYNPLHLGHSDGFGGEMPRPDRSQLHFEVFTRRAVLVVNHLGSWCADLGQAGQRLPAIAEDRSWHVEVFDRQRGYLGLFRQSRQTGRWFQGKHGVHLRGNPGHSGEEQTK